MKGKKDLVISIFITMLSVSCSGVSQIPFETMTKEADSRIGESVTLGGYILNSQPMDGKTDIIVIQAPLGFNGEPQSEDKSEGRFLVSYVGKLNPDDYARHRRITVTGKIAGINSEKPEACPSPCLEIESSKLRIWREYEYMPPMIRGPSR